MTPSLVALYCPGHKVELYSKAVGSMADEVIIDLQDSVPSNQKDNAIGNAIDFLGSFDFSKKPIQVRIDRTRPDDIEALRKFASQITLRIPQAEGSLVEFFDLGFIRVIPLIETARGVSNMAAVSESPGTVLLAMGEADLAADLSTSSDVLIRQIRGSLLIASRSAGLPRPMMSAWTRLSDQDGLIADCRHGEEMGFYGRVAIHPKQISAIVDGFSSAERRDRESRVIRDSLGTEGGVALDAGGNMVDSAWLRRPDLMD
jgi:citrate lyase subunit beta/citryl-CoA lyase